MLGVCSVHTAHARPAPGFPTTLPHSPCAPPLPGLQLLRVEARAIREELLRTAVDRTTIMQKQVDGYLRGGLGVVRCVPLRCMHVTA